ncbi:hypothetical protein ACFX2J_009697 [Malus domestica]
MTASHHNIPSPPAATLINGSNSGGFMPMRRHRMMMHMSFFWSHSAEVLFTGWPGPDRPAMYAISLVFVFLLGVLVEWLSHSRLIKTGTNIVTAGLLRTCLYTVRSGVSYLVMLAVMSFNGGVFLATVGGHAVGFLVFGSGVWKKSGGSGTERPSDLPPMSYITPKTTRKPCNAQISNKERMEDMMKMNMQMNFHWGNEATILFKGWPNESTGMYILALLFVFVLAFAMETLSAWPVVKPSMNPIVAGITHASIYAVRIGMGYLVMLAVMSFNAGIFIVAVAGHTFGYFIVKASALVLAKPAASPA